MRDPTDVIGMQREAEQREHEAAERAEQRASDLRALLSTEQGRRVLTWIVRTSGYLALSFTGQAHTTHFREGRRSVGLDVFQAITGASPEAVPQLLKDIHDDHE